MAALYRLIYSSRQAFADGADIDHEVALIIRASIANNRALDVTGLLLVHQDWFVQVLEGAREKVERLYAAIAADPRHADAAVIEARAAERRDFADWNMCARRMNAQDETILDEIDQRRTFDPAKLTGASALRLMRAVAEGQRRAA